MYQTKKRCSAYSLGASMQEIKSVPPLDLKRQYKPLANEVSGAFNRIFESGGFILGPDVTALEQELANYIKVKNVIGVTSGTDAIWLALKALKIGPGDLVLTSPFTFFATVSAICNAGATPVFADIDPISFNIDPNQVEKVLKQDAQKRIKAIMPVHLYGQAADMNALLAVADKYQVKVIEDSCQAIGTQHEKGPVGALGHLGAFSLFPTKNLGAFGDAGFVTTNDPTLAQDVTLLRTHGSTVRYHHETIGSNCRIDTLQAAILRVFLPHLDSWISQRQSAAAYYDKHLGQFEGLIDIPARVCYSTHTYHQYTIRVSKNKRDELSKYLTDNKIGNSIYYPIPCHLQKALSHLNLKPGSFPVSELAAKEVLSIPIFPGISNEEQDFVIDKIGSWVKGCSLN